MSFNPLILLLIRREVQGKLMFASVEDRREYEVGQPRVEFLRSSTFRSGWIYTTMKILLVKLKGFGVK